MLIAILIILAILCLLGVIFRGNLPNGGYLVPGAAVVALVILVLLLLGYR